MATEEQKQGIWKKVLAIIENETPDVVQYQLNKLIDYHSALPLTDPPTCPQGYHWDSELQKCMLNVGG